jgi:formate dehydrogenase assembly factor FdhD
MVLREIASGKDGRPLPSFEAQKRAREVLTDCGYSWPEQASDSAQQSSGAMGPDSSTDEAMVRQHLKEQLRQLRSLNGKTRRLDDLAV